MLHKWNMYVNEGERRIPSLIDSGRIELPCSNPSADSFRRQYDPAALWEYLQNESDLSQVGQYLSLSSIERPTFDGKRWCVRAAHSLSSGMSSESTREVTWSDIKKIHFWNSSFRSYTGLHQTRGIMDYTLYVSRCFGYCFLLGMTWDDEEDDERHEFTNFYPSIHHYHQQVAVNENDTYIPFDDTQSWYPKDYNQGSVPQNVTVDEVAALAGALDDAADSLQTWSSSVESVDIDNFLVEDSEEG